MASLLLWLEAVSGALIHTVPGAFAAQATLPSGRHVEFENFNKKVTARDSHVPSMHYASVLPESP